MAKNHQEIDKVKGALMSALHKVAKIVEDGRLFTPEIFASYAKQKLGEEAIYLWVLKVKFSYDSEAIGKPAVKISCTHRNSKYIGTFYLAKPYGKFEDKALFAQRFNITQQNINNRNFM